MNNITDKVRCFFLVLKCQFDISDHKNFVNKKYYLRKQEGFSFQFKR